MTTSPMSLPADIGHTLENLDWLVHHRLTYKDYKENMQPQPQKRHSRLCLLSNFMKTKYVSVVVTASLYCPQVAKSNDLK